MGKNTQVLGNNALYISLAGREGFPVYFSGYEEWLSLYCNTIHLKLRITDGCIQLASPGRPQSAPGTIE